jgi:hypothetical protein
MQKNMPSIYMYIHIYTHIHIYIYIYIYMYFQTANAEKYVRNRDTKLKNGEVKKEEIIQRSMCEGIYIHRYKRLDSTKI